MSAQQSQRMREAIDFIETWNLARNLDEFLRAMGKPTDLKTKLWASTFATKMRKGGVALKEFRRGDYAVGDYDWLYLKMVGERAMAQLGKRREEYELGFKEMVELRKEAAQLVAEMRKYKDVAVTKALEKFEAHYTNGKH